MHWHRYPSPRRLRDFGRLNSEETWYRGSSEIDIEDANRMTGQRKGEAQLSRDRRLSYAAFARKYLESLVFGWT
jgi:hypothetical protein